MELNNSILKVNISEHGAELKSVIKNGREYMWKADPAFWGRTSPVLFPFVGGLTDKKYRLNGKEYTMGQHGFARDNKFEIKERTNNSVTFIFKSNKKTLEIYPFNFTLEIKYVLKNSSIKVEWIVKNEDNTKMLFSIGAHPAFNLKDEQNYFMFDYDKDITYHLLDESGLYSTEQHILKNNGYTPITKGMFDNDALIIEETPVHAVSLCDADKNPYVTVKFDAPLFGLWSPGDSPFVCIEPWYGRCDRSGFCGELSEKDYIYSLEPNNKFKADYEIEFI